MSNASFDTLSVARGLKAAGVEARQADAIVEAMDKFTGQFVTVKHFDAAVAKLDTRIDAVRTELQASIDTTRSDLQASIDTTRSDLQASIDTTRSDLQASIHAGQAEMTRFLVIVVGAIIAANALMIGILRFFPRDGAVM
ncbi:MAG: hypothetical protein OXQ89_09685 [Rhodospirillaceae bacterium]|nr:hypothetical protein [Rhodospirillaceae bacterium]MDD9998001.1 hypothetical protein [Rhodospirillaceae bacterium]